jgi:hypothetical protein
MNQIEEKLDQILQASQKLDTLEDELKKMALAISSLCLPNPRLYDGKRSFREYLKEFNRVATAHGWLPTRCTQILPLFLEGEALAAYESLTTTQRSNWHDLVTNLQIKLAKVPTSETNDADPKLLASLGHQ